MVLVNRLDPIRAAFRTVVSRASDAYKRSALFASAGMLTVLLAASSVIACNAQAAYDLSADFANQNPNGAWSYGWSVSLGSEFIPYTYWIPVNSSNQVGPPAIFAGWWATANPVATYGTAWAIVQDVSGAPIVAPPWAPHELWLPGEVGLQGGNEGEYDVARFTAPRAGYYFVSASFTDIDYSATTDVHVLLNSKSVYDSTVIGNGTSNSPAVTQTCSGGFSLKAGDTLDFCVGDDGNGADYDRTGVEAVITLGTAPKIEALTFAPATVTGGKSSVGKVTLSKSFTVPISVLLTSADPATAAVPASVVVPAGSTSVTFPVTSYPVASDTPVLINATCQRSTVKREFDVEAPELSSLAVSPKSLKGGASSTGTIKLTGAIANGANPFVVVLSSNAGVVTVPATVTIPSGSTSVTFPITTTAVASKTSVTISATANGISKSVKLTVNP